MNPQPSRMANKPATPSHGTCTHTQPLDCLPPAAGSEVISTFLGRTAADDAPADDASSLSEDFRHNGWAPFRRKVLQALLSTEGISPRRIGAFRMCGADAYVEGRRRVVNLGTASGPNTFGDEYRIRSTKCHDRFCVPCSQERSNRIRHALLTHMKPLNQLKLITLTQRNFKTTLTAALDKITRCFRLLRNKTLWKKKIAGGVWIIETKIGENSGEWHCHVHCLAEGKFINAFELSALWLQITGDSKIVKVDAVGAKTGAVTYITKYITKAADHSIVMDPTRLREAIIAFTGRRLVSTFGSWRGLELMEKPPHDPDIITDEKTGRTYDAPQWRPIGSLDALIAAAAAGNQNAAHVIRKLRRGTGPPGAEHLRQLPPIPA